MRSTIGRAVAFTATLAATAAAVATPASVQGTVEAVRQRGHVVCGASQGTIGFGIPDSQGYWRGLDVDTCRAVAAAVLGDRERVRFVPLTGQARLIALQSGEVDVLPRTTTWTLQRDANGVNFAFPNYYEHPGVLVRRDAGVTEIGGASECRATARRRSLRRLPGCSTTASRPSPRCCRTRRALPARSCRPAPG